MHDALKMRRVLCLVLLCLLLTSGVDAFGPFSRDGRNDGFRFFGWRGRQKADKEEPQSQDDEPLDKVDIDAPEEATPEKDWHEVESGWFSLGAKTIEEQLDEQTTEKSSTEADSEISEKDKTRETFPFSVDVPSSDPHLIELDEASGEALETGSVLVDSEMPEDGIEDSQGRADMMDMGHSSADESRQGRTRHSAHVSYPQRTAPEHRVESVRQEPEWSAPYSARTQDPRAPLKQIETSQESTAKPSITMKPPAKIEPEEQSKSEVESKLFDIIKRSSEQSREESHEGETETETTEVPAGTKGHETTGVTEHPDPSQIEETGLEKSHGEKPQKKIETKVTATPVEQEKTLSEKTHSVTEPEMRVTTASAQPTEPEPRELIVTDANRTVIASSEDFLHHMRGMGIDTAGIQTDIDTPEGKVAIQIRDSSAMKLERLHFTAMQDAVVILKIVGGDVDLADVAIGSPFDALSPTRTLKQTATLSTGLVIEGGAAVSITDSQFESATDTMIRVNDGSSFTCNGCTFNNNEGSEGGAISVKNSNATFDDCHMNNNAATRDGGSIHFRGNSCSGGLVTSLTINRTKFERDRAAQSGASIFINCVRDAHISGSLFDSGTATDGGAVYVQQIHELGINESDFLKNVANGAGGCLFVEDTYLLSVIDSNFKNNKAISSVGGAGFIARSIETTFRRCNFNKNNAVEGGALSIVEPHANYARMFIQSSTFSNNKAKERGGAVLVERDSQLASSESEQIENAYVRIEKSTFAHNTAGQGGAVYVTSESDGDNNLLISVLTTEFTENTAEVKGGGIYCGNHASMDVASSSFDANSATTAANAAKECGCHIDVDNTVKMSGSSSNTRVTDICESDRISTGNSNDKKTYALVYVFVALGVICVFCVMAFAAVVRKRRSMNQPNPNGSFHRSLSRYVGPDRSLSIMSQPFLPEDGYDDEKLGNRSGISLLRSQTLGEMDYYIRDGNEGHAESLDHDVMIADQEERATLQQTISADDAFFDSLIEDQGAATSMQRLASIPEIASHPTDEKFSL